ncbi:hypothetical protein U2I54_27370 [Bacillus pseudomycoides]|uniref:MarR family transcriptional regulator n=1 Tax=Bacillus bingmayongensis TaxID=1150157 RepID=A0ABU5K5U7_9BACI|nr:hypothetical protein [Bacillus pseudomycoides]
MIHFDILKLGNELIQKINVLQNQLNIQLASRYEHKIDNQLTAKQILLLELIWMGVLQQRIWLAI